MDLSVVTTATVEREDEGSEDETLDLMVLAAKGLTCSLDGEAEAVVPVQADAEEEEGRKEEEEEELKKGEDEEKGASLLGGKERQEEEEVKAKAALGERTVKQLRLMLKQRKVDATQCTDKQELVDLVYDSSLNPGKYKLKKQQGGKTSNNSSSNNSSSSCSGSSGGCGGGGGSGGGSVQPVGNKARPAFRGAHGMGYLTARFQQLYFDANGGDNSSPSLNKTPAMMGLVADTAMEAPLYFWQLYSLIGRKPVDELISRFYDRVWALPKEDAWFKLAFTNAGSKETAIEAQVQMWLDVFGMGKQYHGGETRLTFHHKQTDGVLNQRGAVKWLDLMRESLDAQVFGPDERRIRGAINSFLRVAMGKYAKEFCFDSSKLQYETLQKKKK